MQTTELYSLLSLRAYRRYGTGSARETTSGDDVRDVRCVIHSNRSSCWFSQRCKMLLEICFFLFVFVLRRCSSQHASFAGLERFFCGELSSSEIGRRGNSEREMLRRILISVSNAASLIV